MFYNCIISLCLQYGKDYEYEAPVKLLDKLLHDFPQSLDEQIVVVSQVKPSYCNADVSNIMFDCAHFVVDACLIVKFIEGTCR